MVGMDVDGRFEGAEEGTWVVGFDVGDVVGASVVGKDGVGAVDGSGVGLDVVGAVDGSGVGFAVVGEVDGSGVGFAVVGASVVGFGEGRGDGRRVGLGVKMDGGAVSRPRK
jgi:hypothetical protein